MRPSLLHRETAPEARTARVAALRRLDPMARARERLRRLSCRLDALGTSERPWTRRLGATVIALSSLIVAGLRVFDPEAARLAPRRGRVPSAGALGLVASGLVALGASQVASPYSFKDIPYAWYFGLPHPTFPPTAATPTTGLGALLGVIAVLGGMVLLIVAWLWLLRLRARDQGPTWLQLGMIFAGWVAPLLVIAPLFSRDVYSYVAQGEMTTHHISPYLYGPGVLGTGNPFTLLTDPLWRQSPSPYGPLFLEIDSWLVSATGHSELPSVALLRLLALAGVVMASVGVGVIAKRLGRDPLRAVLLVALNPLVLLHLIGGAHNDALMAGLLVLGVAAAMLDLPLLGVVLCALAAAIKAPAALGVVFISWTYLWRRGGARSRHVIGLGLGGAIGLGIMDGLGSVTGLGWGWIKGLSNADIVRVWLDPPTGLGMLFEKLLGLVGLSGLDGSAMSATRILGILLGVTVIVALLGRVERIGMVKALGLALLTATLCTPAIEPWYLSWAIVALAPVVARRSLSLLVAGSAFGCFLGLPIGSVLIDQLGAGPRWLTFTLCLGAVGGALVVAVREWTRATKPDGRGVPEPDLVGLESNTVGS